MNKRINYRITETTDQRIKTELVQRGFTGNGGFDAMMNTLFDHKCSTDITPASLLEWLDLAPEDQDYIADTLQRTGVDLAEEMRIGLLARFRSLDAAQDHLKKIDLEDPEARKRRLGAGEKALEQVVTKLIAENNAATENADRVFISGGLLVMIARCGKQTAKDFVDKYAAALATHHGQFGWHSATEGQKHNQWSSRKYKALVAEYGPTSR
jgi:hypothetical protein